MDDDGLRAQLLYLGRVIDNVVDSRLSNGTSALHDYVDGEQRRRTSLLAVGALVVAIFLLLAYPMSHRLTVDESAGRDAEWKLRSGLSLVNELGATSLAGDFVMQPTPTGVRPSLDLDSLRSLLKLPSGSTVRFGLYSGRSYRGEERETPVWIVITPDAGSELCIRCKPFEVFPFSIYDDTAAPEIISEGIFSSVPVAVTG